MRRCKNVYLCFMGAVFLLSLYNFVSLSVVDGVPPKIPDSQEYPDTEFHRELRAALSEVEDGEAADGGGRDAFELEFEDLNPHVFRQTGAINLGEEDQIEEMGEGEEADEGQDDSDEAPATTADTSALFWPAEVELALPDGLRGAGMDSCRQFRNKFHELGVNSTKRGDYRKCGRPQNAHAILNDGTELCVRHRKPHDYFVAGDLLSFALSQLLELNNVPCVILERVQDSDTWGHPDLAALAWSAGDVVGLSEWVPATAHLPMPRKVVDALVAGSSLTYADFEHELMRDKVALAQWSDIVVFDYLTGHYDRIASLQDEADKQNDPLLLRDNMRNMAGDGDGNLWVFDNEAGLLDAYALLYQEVPSKNHLRFQRFHRDILNVFCVFRKATVQAVSQLYQASSPVDTLVSFAKDSEPLLDKLKWQDDIRFSYLRRHLKQRLEELIGHFKRCSEIEPPPQP